MSELKKKRGRKPKNFLEEPPVDEVVEKKKRGRKKKYEIENFEKILNRNDINNFNHSIIYSDDEIENVVEETTVKKIAFGNLDITVSKKPANDIIQNYKNNISTIINEDEWGSDEETPIVEESFEKCYDTTKKYIPGNVSNFKEKNNEESIKRIRVVTCIKNILDFEEWPETTDIHCWWCCHRFEGCPCTLPTKYDPLRKRFQFVGIFCSWNCTKSYNFELNDHKKYDRSQLITLLVQQLYGIVNAINIKCAPPRQTLKMFGGYLDISEFRNNNSTVDKYHMNLVHSNYIYPEIMEISNVKIKTVPKNLRLSRT